MRVDMLCDVDLESHVRETRNELDLTGYRELFGKINYGDGLIAIVVILICKESGIMFKRRVRFEKKIATLYLDIILDHRLMVEATPEMRRSILVARLAEDIPAVLAKYSIKDFDRSAFQKDLLTWLKGIH